MPHPAEKANIKISYTHSSDTPRGVRETQSWGSALYCTCNAAWVWCSQKSLSSAPWRNCPSFLIYLLCSQTAPYKKPKQTLHFLTVRIIISSSDDNATPKAHFPTAPRDCHGERKEGKHTLSLSLCLSTTYLVAPTRAKNETALRGLISWLLSQTPGVSPSTPRKSPTPLTVTGIPHRPCVKRRTKIVLQCCRATHSSDPQVL